MQINREPRRKELILEARHSRCIEASNKIRSKLSPRLFMPRAPIYRYTNKTQHCTKELKSKFFKSQNFKTINTNTDFAKDSTTQKRCQRIQNSENFVKRSRGKHRKRSYRDQNYKAMDNITDHSFKKPKQADLKRSKESKTDKNAAKRLRKQQGLTKSNCNAVKAQKSITNSKAFNKKSKEDVKGKWDNLKVIGNANSTDNTRYMTDGEIVFIRDKDQGNMEHYSRVENKKTVKTSGTYNFGSSNQVQSKYYDLNCQRTADENQTKDCRHYFSNNNSENSLKSSVPRSEYNCQKSNISREQTPKESITTITDLHKEIVRNQPVK
ncbi:uncharacterized protein LOC119609312 isoform X2 [Lucilia sericata]|uniref:uncharacterized protein LOC119609312 isoform X2 n=1 Tax=Lucilia sericata TaxID=13632 RepID=UPI0018A8155C|nr:uncharacterized protein LOC119609312 isoform X2 [Lucilia sericata]